MRHIAVTFATLLLSALFLASVSVNAAGPSSDCDYGHRCQILGDLIYASMVFSIQTANMR